MSVSVIVTPCDRVKDLDAGDYEEFITIYDAPHMKGLTPAVAREAAKLAMLDCAIVRTIPPLQGNRFRRDWVTAYRVTPRTVRRISWRKAYGLE